MIYIFCRRPSEGAQELEDALNDLGCPARRTQGKLLRERFRDGKDRLVCWGDHAEGKEGLNNQLPMTKYEEALTLAAAGVPTITVALAAIRHLQPERPMFNVDTHGMINEANARVLLERVHEYLAAPLPPAEEWLGRRNNHMGGSDLLAPGRADYFSRKEDIRDEYRLHIFGGKSIRAGHKVVREGFDAAHPWIRSFDAGWRIQYGGFSSTKHMREVSAGAVKALGLDFGAVDLGRCADGRLIVLEVNRRPGIEGGTTNAYASKIAEWSRA